MNASRAARTGEIVRPNGTEGIWTFIFIDMVIFALIFMVFASERFRLPGVYMASQGQLNEWFAFANTLILLTSSWVMVEAVHAVRDGLARRGAAQLGKVLILGALFCGLKVWEYGAKYRAGIGLTENSFFSLYYVITIIHLAHLVGTMCFIAGVRARLRRNGAAASITIVENVGLFWHFVDVLWVFIFPLLYLIGRP